MRTVSIILLLFFIGAFSVNTVMAQAYDELFENSETGKDISERLPSIAELQELAIENSPLLKLYDADIVIRELQIKSVRRDWMNGFGVEAGAKYGLFDNLIITEDLGLGESSTQSTEQTRYSVGVYFKMPITSILQKVNVGMAKAETEKMKYQRESSVKELKKLVIIQYGNIIRAHKKLIIFISALEAMKVQMIEAELNYKNGIISLVDYTDMKNALYDAELSYEEVKVEYLTGLIIMQETVGADFNLN